MWRVQCQQEHVAAKSGNLVSDKSKNDLRHLKANSLTPQTFTFSKELRESVSKVHHRQKADLAIKKEKKYQNEKKRKSEAIRIDMEELKSKILLLEKVQKTVKSNPEKLLCKAPYDSLNAHAYAIKVKSDMDEQNRKLRVKRWRTL